MPINKAPGEVVQMRPTLGRPCPAKVTAVLGLPEPTQLPCGLLSGHEGQHEYRITWS